MAQIDNRYATGVGSRTDVAVDEGLRAYMLRVYNYMAAGVALTGVVAYIIFSYSVTSDPALAASTGGRIMALHRGMYLTPFGQAIFASPLMWVLVPLFLAFARPTLSSAPCSQAGFSERASIVSVLVVAG